MAKWFGVHYNQEFSSQVEESTQVLTCYLIKEEIIIINIILSLFYWIYAKFIYSSTHYVFWYSSCWRWLWQ